MADAIIRVEAGRAKRIAASLKLLGQGYRQRVEGEIGGQVQEMLGKVAALFEGAEIVEEPALIEEERLPTGAFDTGGAR